MTRQRICAITLFLLLAVAYSPLQAVHAAGTDEIKDYAIDILPQEDGSTVNTYAINWCVISNSAGPLTWITLGMPNEQYEIVSSSGDVASANPYDEGFNYQVRIDLPRDVNANECVNFSVQIHQYGLAKLDETTGEIGFYFTPGWFDEVPVDHLQVTWHLPSDATQVKSFNPKPTTQSDGQAIWESDLQPGDKYPISVIYDKAAFPNFDPNKTSSSAPTDSIPTAYSYSTEVPITNIDTGVPVSVLPVLFRSFSLTSCLCMCMILILVLFFIFVVLRSIGSATRSYRGGGFFGGYTGGGSRPSGGGGWSSGGGGIFGSGSGGGGSITHRSGGGSGSFGGRGMSCACVSSGCACACAGGGRAGCSRKGFDVSSLFKDRSEKNNP